MQLFGAIVPKLVGQTQFFDNEYDWQPVYTVYSDITIKLFGMHKKITALLRECDRPSVLLVALLELLSRIEVIGDNYYPDDENNDDHFKEQFYRFLSYDSEKVRTLSARCLTRFSKFYEMPTFLRAIVPLLFYVKNSNFKHGLVMTIICMLKKYQSDVRFTQFDEVKPLIPEIRSLFQNYSDKIGGTTTSYYIRFYLFELFLLMGYEKDDRLVMETMFGRLTVSDLDVAKNLRSGQIDEHQNFGYNAWKRKMEMSYSLLSVDDDKDK